MKNIVVLLCCFEIAVLVACSTSQHKNQAVRRPHAPAVASLEPAAQDAQVKKQEELRQDQKDKALVLGRKSQLQVGQISSYPQKKDHPVEVPMLSAKAVSEDQLFGELYQRFERNDEIGFRSRLQMWMTKYPQSSRTDEALYMAGMMGVSNKNYGPALKYFNQILNQYPRSNKTNAALFAKGAIYRKMHMDSLAKENFQRVIARSPGSPEALRAQSEMRLFK